MDSQYKKWYDKGWKYSETAADPSLEHGDRKGYPEAWYDGYHDSAAGRKKYYLYEENHTNEHWLHRRLF